MNYVYILRCGDGSLYTGWTNDPEKRLRAHREGRGAKYTRSRQPVEPVYYEACATKEQAMSREWHIKQLSRAQKLELIRNYNGGMNNMKTVSTDKAPSAIGPYSQAQISAGMVYTSGQIGIDPSTGELAIGIEAQAEQVFTNIAQLLRAAGSDISRTVKTTVFIRHMDDFAAVNAVYARHFTQPFPARSCVEVAALPKDALVECEVIAELCE